MKKYFIFLVFLSFTTIGQTIEVNYYENLKVQDQEQFKLMPKNVQIAYEANIFSFKLTTDGKSSLYQNAKFNLKIKDETYESTTINEVGDTIKSVTKSSGIDLKSKEKIYYKDFKNNKSYNEQFYDEKISIVDSLAIFKWEILDESEMILGYNCKKAVTKIHGRDTYAWFTDEIPISDGPFMYSGLPGLILKTSSKNNEIVAHAISIKNEPFDSSPPVFTGKIYNYKTLKEYIEKKNKERNRF
ncbi:GLPGLI family protein [Flavobacterium lacus]|uniref:GLPGLI family protein n=1 Tax=Flavobacterium lacus TaxID=1353778 RepID=A0A328WWB3_9FLAO|nr:GLPGLI family protein [Flavobacterium lacus]RAR48124.1 GLPGLI family protein [Flavobacterium lacus]